MPPFDAVVFDNDGLLLDTEEAWTRAEEELFTRRGRIWTVEHKRELIGSSGSLAQAKLERMLDAPGEGRAIMGGLHDLVMEEARKPVGPRPGAFELLALLQGAGIPLGLASNSTRPFVERVLASAGLVGERLPFVVVVTASDVAHPKSAPDLYLAACAALGADPTRCAGLEDSATGAEAAVAAGLFTIAVPYFPDGPMPAGIALRAPSLAALEVLAALGVG